MPRPVDSGATYLPALDGLRALAVGLVIAYHVGVPGASGGLLGVGVFFTVSGFLITSILLREWRRLGHLRLGRFWLRRARRLLPAVILLLVAVMTTVAIVEPQRWAQRLKEALFALFYVANWATIARGESYFERFDAPSPMSHLWSLSVEEQFYLGWPLILMGILLLSRRIRPARSQWDLTQRDRYLPVAAAVIVVLGLVSFLVMAFVATPGFDNTRAYEGTDTRAGGLLWGAAMAMVWRPEHWVAGRSPRSRSLIDALALGGVVGVLALAATTSEQSLTIYRWGIAALTLATLAVIVGVSASGTLTEKVFGWLPFRWIGERSYGIYLWHMPVVAYTPRLAAQQHPVLIGVAQVALTVLIASLSWTLVENPIRTHGLVGALRLRRPDGARVGIPSAVWGTAVVLAIAVAGQTLATRVPQPSKEELASQDASAPAAVPSVPALPSSTGGPSEPAPAQPTTSCTHVAHIGDSTSVGLMSTSFLPDATQRVDAQYKQFGAQDVVTDIDGARAIEEHYQGHANGAEAVQKLVDTGYRGCWVIALGLNDAATIGKGGTPVTARNRVDAIMKKINPEDPVIWVSSVTMPWATPLYSNRYMTAWNEDVTKAADDYPNMWVYSWSSDVARWTPDEKAKLFQADGIHYTTRGYAVRGRGIARAVALAFPKDADRVPQKVLSAGTVDQIMAPRQD